MQKIMKKLLLESKHSQEEIAGFVIIVVIVSIIGLILLSLSIGKGERKTENNAEISYFLDAAMLYTTDCAVNFIPQYKNIQELIISCFNKENCLNGNESCIVLNQEFEKIIKKSLIINPNSPNKDYKLNIYFRIPNSTTQNIEILKKDNKLKDCSLNLGGANSIPYGEGIIEVELEVCKG